MRRNAGKSDSLSRGIEEFNRREFFQCHETLEALWMGQPEPERQFTQGIIQIAVGYFHALRNNRRGARKLLKRGLERVNLFGAAHEGINVGEFAAIVEGDLSKLEATPDEDDVELVIPCIKFAGCR